MYIIIVPCKQEPKEEDDEYDEEESKPPTPPPREARVSAPYPPSPSRVLGSGQGGMSGPGNERELLAQREAELAKLRAHIANVTAEKEALRKKVRIFVE